MTHVMRAGDLIGLPVVSIATGEDVAEIRDVVYDASRHRLLGFTLNKRGFFAGRLRDVLGAGSVAAIGGDAVMVSDETAITESENPRELEDSAATRLGDRKPRALGRRQQPRHRLGRDHRDRRGGPRPSGMR